MRPFTCGQQNGGLGSQERWGLLPPSIPSTAADPSRTPGYATHAVEAPRHKRVLRAQQLEEVVRPEVVPDVGEDGNPDVGLGVNREATQRWAEVATRAHMRRLRASRWANKVLTCGTMHPAHRAATGAQPHVDMRHDPKLHCASCTHTPSGKTFRRFLFPFGSAPPHVSTRTLALGAAPQTTPPAPRTLTQKRCHMGLPWSACSGKRKGREGRPVPSTHEHGRNLQHPVLLGEPPSPKSLRAALLATGNWLWYPTQRRSFLPCERRAQRRAQRVVRIAASALPSAHGCLPLFPTPAAANPTPLCRSWALNHGCGCGSLAPFLPPYTHGTRRRSGACPWPWAVCPLPPCPPAPTQPVPHLPRSRCWEQATRAACRDTQ